MAENRVATAVVGVGYLGKYHAEKYAASSKAKLVAVVDSDGARAKEIGAALGVEALTDYHALFGKVQCASVAVPTRFHF